MIRFLLFFLVCVKAYESSITQIQSFEQFVQFYGKQYRDDEYARRANFVDNTKRLVEAKKLSGIPLYYSFYSDFSEFRFIKFLMTNNAYPEPNLNELEYLKEKTTPISQSADWKLYSPISVGIDPSFKCASSWAVAVTTIMYIQYKTIDPLWNDLFSVQQLLDCVNDRKANSPDSCDGASIESALRYVFEKGICLEKDYNPYSGSREKCRRISCNRYYIKSYKRIYPDMNSFLTAVSKGPVLTTVGVNPDLLQFYISAPNKNRTFMTGEYHRYYVSGVLDGYSLSNEAVSLQLPAFHAYTKSIFYHLSPSCFHNATVLPSCHTDADVLMKYAYSLEVEPLPSYTHSFHYSLVEFDSLFPLFAENNWIIPWSFTLYQDISIWGFNADELNDLIVSVDDSIIDSINQQNQCQIETIQIIGLYPIQCPLTKNPPETDDDEDYEIDTEYIPDSSCQLNQTQVLNLVSLLSHCNHLHSILLYDHNFSGETIALLLQAIIDNMKNWPDFQFLHIQSVIYQDSSSKTIKDSIQQLIDHSIFVSGISLLDYKDAYEETSLFYSLMKTNKKKNVYYTQSIHAETMEQFVLSTPFRFASKITLQNACTDNPTDCSYIPQSLSSLFNEQPHYYLRYLDLTNNQITTKEFFRLLIALKNYPRLSTIILDNNCVDDSLYTSFRVFIQDSTIFPSLRRISLLNNAFSPEGCDRMKQIFLTQYDRSTILYC